MNRNPGKKAFWRLFSPLVAYWLVQLVFSFLTSCVMMAVKAKELAPVLFVDEQSATEAELESVFATVNQIAMEFYAQYQLECATALAVGLIVVMGVLFWQDRKKEALGQIKPFQMSDMRAMLENAGYGQPGYGQGLSGSTGYGQNGYGQNASGNAGYDQIGQGQVGASQSAQNQGQAGQTKTKETVSFGKYVLLAGLGVSFCLAVNCIIGMTQLALMDEAYQEAAAALYAPSFVIQLLCSGIIIPLSEELFYRGVVFKRFREQLPFMGAALISCFLFSASHGNLVQGLYTAGLGLLLAYVYEKYGSLKAPLCLHIVTNMASLLFTQLGVFDYLMANKGVMAMLAIAGTFVGTSIFVNIQKIFSRQTTQNEL